MVPRQAERPRNNCWIDSYLWRAMRHRKKSLKLGRKAEHRKEFVVTQVCSLIEHQRIATTLSKSKGVAPTVKQEKPAVPPGEEPKPKKRRWFGRRSAEER